VPRRAEAMEGRGAVAVGVRDEQVDEERRERGAVSPGMRVLGGLAAFCSRFWGYCWSC
jgi:hypothetical protein